MKKALSRLQSEELLTFQMAFIQTVDILFPADTLTNDLLSSQRRSIVGWKNANERRESCERRQKPLNERCS